MGLACKTQMNDAMKREESWENQFDTMPQNSHGLWWLSGNGQQEKSKYKQTLQAEHWA